VACGSGSPIAGSNEWPADWRTAADELPGLTLTHTGQESPLSGPELLVAAVTQSGQPVKLLTLGPLTNVAEALALDPGLVDNLDTVYVMGGAVEADGNVFANQYAEWNVWIDPAAAQVLLESGASIVLVPLDATNDVPVTVSWLDRLATDRTTPAANAVYDLFAGNPGVLEGGFYFWDELAAAVLTDHSYVTLADATVTVVADGPEEGWTKPVPDGVPVQVAVGADALRLERDLISILNGEGPLEVVAADPALVAYFEQLEEIGAILDNTISTWFEENEDRVDVVFDPQDADIEEAKEVLDDLVMTFMDAMRNDRALSGAVTAPEAAAATHQAYLDAVDQVLTLEDEMLAELDAAGPDDDVEELGSSLFAAFEGVDRACLDLQELADVSGVSVRLFCVGE
jgi:inosine-uridine nucleoside N-ribohydrolase